MVSLFSEIDFSRLKKDSDSSEARKLTADEVRSGGYDGWLRVEIIDAYKGNSKKNTSYLSVTFESTFDSDPWSITNCYFSIEDLRDLCLSIGISSLKEGDLPDAVIGKRLEICCKLRGKFVSVRSHREWSVQGELPVQAVAQ